MKYNKVIMLKNGIECCLRNGMEWNVMGKLYLTTLI